MKMLKEYICRGGPVVKDRKKLIFGINRHRAWQIIKECSERAGLHKLINPETGKEENSDENNIKQESHEKPDYSNESHGIVSNENSNNHEVNKSNQIHRETNEGDRTEDTQESPNPKESDSNTYSQSKENQEKSGIITQLIAEETDQEQEEENDQYDQTKILEDIMNGRGKQGWELVQISFGKDGLMAFWKRRLKNRERKP